MFGKVLIDGKEVEMAANAASPYIYRQISHEDFLAKAQEETPDPDIFQKMGFVMAKQAESDKIADLMKIPIDEFYEWLTQFEPLSVLVAAGDISSLYMGQTEGLSTPKKEDA